MATFFSDGDDARRGNNHASKQARDNFPLTAVLHPSPSPVVAYAHRIHHDRVITLRLPHSKPDGDTSRMASDSSQPGSTSNHRASFSSTDDDAILPVCEQTILPSIKALIQVPDSPTRSVQPNIHCNCRPPNSTPRRRRSKPALSECTRRPSSRVKKTNGPTVHLQSRPSLSTRTLPLHSLRP